MVTRLRMWSPLRWFATLSLIVVAVVVVVVIVQVARDETWLDAVKTGAPIGGALAALLSLVATSVSLTANWRRQRRLTTLRAWSDWSDKSAQSRRRLTRALGVEAFPAAVGQALAQDHAYMAGGIDLSRDDFRDRVVKDLAGTLNGLERLAVGVEMGIYDVETLRRVGGTIIVRQWERGHEYVTARRNHPDPKRRQEKVFMALESLAVQLERHRVSEERHNLDQQRLAILRRNR